MHRSSISLCAFSPSSPIPPHPRWEASRSPDPQWDPHSTPQGRRWRHADCSPMQASQGDPCISPGDPAMPHGPQGGPSSPGTSQRDACIPPASQRDPSTMDSPPGRTLTGVHQTRLCLVGTLKGVGRESYGVLPNAALSCMASECNTLLHGFRNAQAPSPGWMDPLQPCCGIRSAESMQAEREGLHEVSRPPGVLSPGFRVPIQAQNKNLGPACWQPKEATRALQLQLLVLCASAPLLLHSQRLWPPICATWRP